MIFSVVFITTIAFIYLIDFFVGILENPYLFVADMMIIALLFMILGIGYFYKNRGLIISTALLILMIVLHLALTSVSLLSPWSIVFVWAELILLIYVVLAIVFQVKKNIGVFNNAKLIEEVSRTVFLNYDTRTELVTLTFSDSFKAYYRFTKTEMVLDIPTYTRFLADEDKPKVQTVLSHFDTMSSELETTATYSFPGLDEKLIFNIRLAKKNRYQIFGIQNDMTEVNNLSTSLQSQTDELEQLEKEYRTIMTHTSEMILRVDKDGIILYATDSFKQLFNDEPVIGQNILKLNETLTGKFSKQWLDDLLKEKSMKGITEFLIDGARRYYYWQNDVVLDANEEIDYIISIGRDVTDIQKLNQQLEFSTTHDEQTGLLNRQGLYKVFEERLKKQDLTFFYLEIRDFVMFNEFYGVETGIELLKILADRLKSFTRQFGHVIHLGGEKFLLVIQRNEMNPNELLMRLNKKLVKTFYTSDAKISVTIDVGYSYYKEDASALNQAITYAALAMEYAKKINDGKIYPFKPSLLDLANEQF